VAAKLQLESPVARRFEASRLWHFNLYGALAGGIGGGVLMCVVAGIILFSSGERRQGFLFAGAVIGCAIIGFLCLYPGNQIAVYPYAVEVEEGRGLRLFAPLKQVYVPIQDVQAVRRSFLSLGWVVTLRKGPRLLTRFIIPGAFGPQGAELAREIQEQIEKLG
jgi:hypothetical protein